jgi:hypothetical protein
MEEWKPKTWGEQQYFNNLSLEPQSLTCLHCCNVLVLQQQGTIKGANKYTTCWWTICRWWQLKLVVCDEKWGYRRCRKDPPKSWIEDRMHDKREWVIKGNTMAGYEHCKLFVLLWHN